MLDSVLTESEPHLAPFEHVIRGDIEPEVADHLVQLIGRLLCVHAVTEAAAHHAGHPPVQLAPPRQNHPALAATEGDARVVVLAVLWGGGGGREGSESPGPRGDRG